MSKTEDYYYDRLAKAAADLEEAKRRVADDKLGRIDVEFDHSCDAEVKVRTI